MRVIIYVPSVHGVARTRTVEAIERELKRRGHDIVGNTERGTDAWAALASGQAERVAGRPDHLIELSNLQLWASIPQRPWALAVAPAGAMSRLAALPPVAWVGDRIRRRPGRTATTGAVAAGLITAVVLGMTSRDEPSSPEVAPPPLQPSPTAPARTPSPSRPAPHSETPGPASPALTGRTRPQAPPARVAPSPARTARPPSSRPPGSPPAATRPPASRPPSIPPPVATPTPTPEAALHCVIRLDTPLGSVRLLCSRTRGQPI